MIRTTGQASLTRKGRISISLLALLGLVFGLLLTACSMSGGRDNTYIIGTNPPEIGDGGFLSGDICGPPCFFGVIPGTTTKTDAIQTLQSRGLYQGCEEFDNTRQGGIHAIGCNNIVVFLDKNTDIVSGIGFQPSQVITVEEVIVKYGMPSAVSVISVDPSSRGQFTVGMTLYYENINVALGLAEQHSGNYKVDPTSPIATLRYLDNEEYRLLLHGLYLKHWVGYGVYDATTP